MQFMSSERWVKHHSSVSCLSPGCEHLGDQFQQALKFPYKKPLKISDKVSKVGDVYQRSGGQKM